MILQTNEGKKVVLRRLDVDDLENLFDYLRKLSYETKKVFSPHPFDRDSISDLYSDYTRNIGYIAQDTESNKIIAYAIIKIGYLVHDSNRLQSYGMILDKISDCTFAPSVAEAWQSQGVGYGLFHYIVSDLKKLNKKRIILWGGVQANNTKAVNYYMKSGFRALGKFVHNGDNYDMVYDINY